LWTAEKATWMAGEGVQIFGGNGYINEYPLGRLWRDAKLYEIGAGTSEIRRMLIGRELFAETMQSGKSETLQSPVCQQPRMGRATWSAQRPGFFTGLAQPATPQVHVDRLLRQPGAGQ